MPKENYLNGASSSLLVLPVSNRLLIEKVKKNSNNNNDIDIVTTITESVKNNLTTDDQFTVQISENITAGSNTVLAAFDEGSTTIPK